MSAIKNKSTIRLSVLICTYNRANFLTQVVGSLYAQTLSSSFFEVIIIDDGSTDNTQNIINGFADKLNIEYFYQENSGLAAARNKAVSVANSDILIFLDDDDAIDICCLEQHYFSHLKYPAENIAILGYTGLAPSVAYDPLMQYVTEKGCELFSYPHLKHEQVLDFTYFWGGRTSCKRDFLIKNGLFNPVFRFGAEDIELGYRLSQAGLKVIYNKNAISYMLRSLSLDEFCRRSYLQGRSNWVFSQLYTSRVVNNWTKIDNVEEEWGNLKDHYERLIRLAQSLDSTARIYADESLDITPGLNQDLLHRAYYAAFQASRLKGSYEAKHDKENYLFLHDEQSKYLQYESLELNKKFDNFKIHTFEDYKEFEKYYITDINAQRGYEEQLLINNNASPLRLKGYCLSCEEESEFITPVELSKQKENLLILPNWREALSCHYCGLPNRMRAAVYLIKNHLSPAKNSSIYITEQMTPLFNSLKKEYEKIIGSEYLGEHINKGEENKQGIRHEDLTDLSFISNTLDYILSFDVLEHIPEYEKALSEIFRCLKPGGNLLLSAPFSPDLKKTLVRAKISEDGGIKHLMPAEYHGDPLTSEGCLSFYLFGWDLLEKLRKIGFIDVYAILYWSPEFAHLGENQFIFFARKPKIQEG